MTNILQPSAPKSALTDDALYEILKASRSSTHLLRTIADAAVAAQLAQQDGLQPKHHPADVVTDGGRNMFFEGLFPNESERERAQRLRWANDMRAGFESHFGQSWFDKDWFRESGIWTAAWRAALAAQPTPESVVKTAGE